MDPQQAANLMWEAAQRGETWPQAVQGSLEGVAQGYRTQLDLLARHTGAGQRHAGWKIGFTADAVRKLFGSDAPVFGYLLESACVPSGHPFAFGELVRPSLESELCFTLASALAGPGVTARDVAAALEAVAPAFEIIEARGDMAADLPLGVADNVSQKAWVLGEAVRPYPAGLDLGGLRVTIRRNGETLHDVLGRDVIDNQLESIAWLANTLGQYGQQIRAGQRVLSGSFNKPTPIAQGDRWEAEFAGIGSVAATFA